jgi:hypothetical protein
MFAPLVLGFSKGVSNLILSSYVWEDLDKPISYLLTKVIVTYVDVFCMRAKLWKPCKLQCTRVVFKNPAVYVGLCTDNLKTLLSNFLEPDTKLEVRLIVHETWR